MVHLSDLAAEEALYDSRAMDSFVGLDPSRAPVPHETTVCAVSAICLRSTIWGRRLFDEVQRHLAAQD